MQNRVKEFTNPKQQQEKKSYLKLQSHNTYKYDHDLNRDVNNHIHILFSRSISFEDIL